LDTSSEEWRHLCECRDWLDRGIKTRAQMDYLVAQITKKRGAAAAERLRQGMIAERDRRVGK
jgi:sarcosine oxidase delta subunit